MSAHEALYRKTCSSLIEAVAKRKFTPRAVPKLVGDLRGEPEQCLDLNLISEEFYQATNKKLQRLLQSSITPNE